MCCSSRAAADPGRADPGRGSLKHPGRCGVVADDGDQNGDAECAAQLLGDVDQPGRRTGVLRGHTLERGLGERDERQPVAEREEQQARHDAQVRRVRGERAGQREPADRMALPISIVALLFTRLISTRLVTCETTKTVTGIGRNAKPVASEL